MDSLPAAARTRIVATALKRVPGAEVTTPAEDGPTYVRVVDGAARVAATLAAFGWTHTIEDGAIVVPNGQFA